MDINVEEPNSWMSQSLPPPEYEWIVCHHHWRHTTSGRYSRVPVHISLCYLSLRIVVPHELLLLCFITSHSHVWPALLFLGLLLARPSLLIVGFLSLGDLKSVIVWDVRWSCCDIIISRSLRHHNVRPSFLTLAIFSLYFGIIGVNFSLIE